MNHVAETTRRYRVHARHVDSHHAKLLEEASFEAAAVAYLEHLDFALPTTGGDEVSIIVRDVASGHEHCFRLNLHSGETNPCDG